MGFELTPRQVEQRDAAASPATHVLAFGGSRSGKTFGFCRCVAIRALVAPRSRHLIARLHNIDVRQAVMMATWPEMMRACFPGVPYEINKTDQYAIFDNESEVWFGGLDDKERVEKILGKEYVTIYPNESSQIAFQTITTLRTRLAQAAYKEDGTRLPLKAYYDLNPVGKSHWTYSEFVLGVRPDNGIPVREESRAWVQMNPLDNPHLPPEYLEELAGLPERERQRFMDGKYLSEVPNTLWPLSVINDCRVDTSQVPPLKRIVVSLDPSGSDGVGGDTQGLVVAGKGEDDHGYVLEDASDKLSPAGWGELAVKMYHKYSADVIVAEKNYGGAMVESTIRAHDPNVKVKLVSATKGKHVRAEPCAALYENRSDKPCKVHHVGRFEKLEDQMTSFTTDGYQGSGSPDRADALVWALTELMLGETRTVRMLLSAKVRGKAA